MAIKRAKRPTCESSDAVTEQPKRGRGRPRGVKDSRPRKKHANPDLEVATESAQARTEVRTQTDGHDECSFARKLRELMVNINVSEVGRRWADQSDKPIDSCRIRLHHYMAGRRKNPRLATVREIARAIGVHPAALVDW